MTLDELTEHLADAEHASWARWMDWVLNHCCYVTDDGRFCIPIELVARWQRQVKTNYQDLTDAEKESDRKEVTHILGFIRAYARSNDG